MNREPLNLINANIITLNQSMPLANSVTIRNGKIISINSPNKSFKTIDAKGATIIPGFIDAHFHIKNLGQRLEMVNLKDVKNEHDIACLLYTSPSPRD